VFRAGDARGPDRTRRERDIDPFDRDGAARNSRTHLYPLVALVGVDDLGLPRVAQVCSG
jgi:hypothetical protein